MHLYKCQWAFKPHDIQMTSTFSHCAGLLFKDLHSATAHTTVTRSLQLIFTIPPPFLFCQPLVFCHGQRSRELSLTPRLLDFPFLCNFHTPACHLLSASFPLLYFISYTSSAHFCIFYAQASEDMKDNHQRICPDL